MCLYCCGFTSCFPRGESLMRCGGDEDKCTHCFLLLFAPQPAALTFHFPLVLPPVRRFWHRGPDIGQEADVGVATPEVALLLEGHSHGNVGHYAMLANIHSLTPFLPLSSLPVKAPLLLNLGYTGTVPSGLNKQSYYFSHRSESLHQLEKCAGPPITTAAAL